MRYFVEEILPATFLVRHAIYMQTCAHIELEAWRLILLLEGFDPTSPEQVDRFLTTKKLTPRLIKALRSAASSCKVGFAVRIYSVANRIEIGLTNRNLAAHGAWKFDVEQEKLSAEFYWQQGEGKSKQWVHNDGTFTIREIDAAVEDADLLLRELIEIRKELLSQSRSRVFAPQGI